MSNVLVAYVAETDRPELLNIDWLFNLRDKTHQGMIPVVQRGPIIENF